MVLQKKIRKWGNSYGILLAKKELAQYGLEENDPVEISIEKQKKISELFGILKDSPIDAQKMKDEIRKEQAKDDKKIFRQLRNNRIPQR